jgi:hypothetical protein
MTVRRMKTYTGGQGYVYQYYFVGKRPAPDQSSPVSATEYVFDVTADRKTTYAVSVLVLSQALLSWARFHGRPLNEAEQYAAAKMRLFQAFDEVEDMAARGRRLVVDSSALEAALSTLGVD